MMKFKRLFALETIYLQNTIPPACSIHQRPRINTIAPYDQGSKNQPHVLIVDPEQHQGG